LQAGGRGFESHRLHHVCEAGTICEAGTERDLATEEEHKCIAVPLAPHKLFDKLGWWNEIVEDLE
jgi:hypothetical protein